MIYLATAYSYNPAVAHANAVSVLGNLLYVGVPAFSPIAHSHEAAVRCGLRTDWEFWRTLDFKYMDACSEVWVWIDPHCRWEESRGVQAEIVHAVEIGKPIRGLWGDGLFMVTKWPASSTDLIADKNAPCVAIAFGVMNWLCPLTETAP